MLRRTLLISIAVVISFLVSTQAGKVAQTNQSPRQITSTPETALNLNPTLSDDGSSIFFESTLDLSGTVGAQGFQCLKTRLSSSLSPFERIASTRCVAPSSVTDGSTVAFASPEDLLNQNFDRNSEIYTYSHSGLTQLTRTQPSSQSTRVVDGSDQPSLSGDGQFIVFSSNRDLVGLNPDLNNEIYVYEQSSRSFVQLTSTALPAECESPKISADGRTVIFLRRDASDDLKGELKLYDRVAKAERTIVSQVPGLALSVARSVSNDGSRIVYAGETAKDQTQVFLFDVKENSSEQLTKLSSRSSDVNLNPTISGDGKRVAFATRRRVVGPSDGSTELFVYDIPSTSTQQVTDASSKATGDVVASLNFDGSLVAFSFPRVLTETLSNDALANNNEIYLATVQPRAAFGEAQILNAASLESAADAEAPIIALDSIVSLRGASLARHTVEASFANDRLPTSLDGTVVVVNGIPARLLFVSQTEIIFVMPVGLSEGSADVMATNADGFVSRANLSLKKAAPGLFTFTDDRHNDGVVLNADNLTLSPLDPTDGRLRLVAFATGIRYATSPVARVNGELVRVEQVISSTVPGLDEVHLLIPESLRGAGVCTLQLIAGDLASNTVRITLGGSSLRDIMINEFLVDPPDGLAGDANHDGIRSASADEFIEIVNTTNHDIDISNYKLLTRTDGGNPTLRHKFSVPTILSAGTAIVVFGGGNFDLKNSAFGESLAMKASTGSLSLNNSGGSIMLQGNDDSELTSITYGADSAIAVVTNQSVSRAPDLTGPFTAHSLIGGLDGRLFSPGTRVDGTPFRSSNPVFKVLLSNIPGELRPGDKLQINATALDDLNHPLEGVLFAWTSSAPDVVSINAGGVATAIKPGLAFVSATARGVASLPLEITVSSPVPSPSPTPSPSATPIPLPLIAPQLVISEFRTRGVSGAGDEFIEIYNFGNEAIDISGYKIKASNSSGTVGTRLTINANTVIQSHCHFLAVNSSGYSGPVIGDQSFLSGITNDGGIALTLADDTVVDQVGLSNGSAFKEGITLMPFTTDADRSYERKPGAQNGNGIDTNDNSADFIISSPSNPQNLNSPPTPSTIPSPSPSPSPGPTATPSPSPTPSPTPTPGPGPEAPQVVISQVYGGGGNTGAPYRNDFIELFNAGSQLVDLSGWSVQYSGATATTWSVTPLPSFSLKPGQYYLVQEASGGSVGTALPASDTIGTISMSATAGKVALVKSTVSLSGGCPSLSTLVDIVGYGTTASCFLGTGPSPAPGNATALLRKQDGCVNDRNNSTDFQTTAPNPRSSSSPFSACRATSRVKPGTFEISGWWFTLISPTLDSKNIVTALLTTTKLDAINRSALARMRRYT